MRVLSDTAARDEEVGGLTGWYWKHSIYAVLVEIGANRQSCEPSPTLLFKLVLEVVLGVTHQDRSVNTLAR